MNRESRVHAHTPGSERKVWEELLADREVIERLAVTPDELDAVSRCAFLGAVACKEDFLLVLRQIRQAAESQTAPAAAAAMEVPPAVTRRRSSKPKTARMLAAQQRVSTLRPDPHRAADAGSLAEIVRRRTPEQFGVFVFMLILISLSIWILISAILSWRHGFDSKIGVASLSPPAPISCWVASAPARASQGEIA